MVTQNFQDRLRIKDQLGKPDNLSLFGPFRKKEELLIEEGPIVVIKYDLTDVAKWDDPETTWDGGDLNDQWLDYTRDDVLNIVNIENRNNVFIDRFVITTTYASTDNDFASYSHVDETNTTAAVDTTNREVTFTSGQVLQYLAVFKDASDSPQAVVNATLTVTVDSGGFDFELSADGGSNWETVTNGETHTFTNTGSDLRIRITENNSSTGTITLIKCAYTK
jgi:hypothetical protein